MMKLWLVKREDECDYDEFQGFVIAAETSQAARVMAVAEQSKYGSQRKIWADTERAPCTLLANETTVCASGVVLRDFRAG